MMFSELFERFVRETPETVMARAAMEHALAPSALDALFSDHAEQQYEKELLFSSVVDLMSVVVAKIRPSIHAAYRKVAESLPVSMTAVYDKINGVEPAVMAALVKHTADRLGPVVTQMGGEAHDILPGYRVRIIDGNHLRASQRRLKVTRRSKAGPLPGHALVVLDPRLMLAIEMIPCEDGHAQERSLTPAILSLVAANDAWIADRNFCTTALLGGIADRGAYFIVRQHAALPVHSMGTLRSRGPTETGEVFEQAVTVELGDGRLLSARRIVVRLDKKTRDGDAEIAILTNLPSDAADAATLAETYRDRWTLENVFQALTAMFNGELDTLGYPRAALLGFTVALAAYNVLSTVQAALRGAFGAEKIQQEVSGFYVALEVRVHHKGMAIALGPETWTPFHSMTSARFAKTMLRFAKHVNLQTLKRHPRGPKKPVPKRTRFVNKTHVSTARLLAEARKGRP
jgi:Transposase DDE domain